MDNLTSIELFDKQRKAQKRNDIATVKEISGIAKKRLPVIGDWNEAKTILNGMAFPDVRPPNYTSGESHGKGAYIHQLMTFRFYIEPIFGYSIMAKYDYCLACKKTRNKYFAMFNNKENAVYQKWFEKHGEVVNY